NGKPLDSYWFYHSELVKGGRLVLDMGPEPNFEWAAHSEPPRIYDLEPLITPPYISTAEKLFLEKAVVSMKCDTEGADIYFTTDGKQPDKHASMYTESFTINKTTTLKMIAFKGNKASLPATAIFKKTLFRQSVEPGAVEPGLLYNYYSGTFRMVNDFVEMEPLKSGIVSNFTIESRESETFFGFDFKGYIKIETDGLYTFYLKTNDGGKLYLAEEPIIDNDGLHPAIERTKTLALKKGTYPILVKYFQEGGTNMLKASWKGPGIEKQEIPGSVLFH
ncbi:MAG: chitobiase/beta-hexosaminidase C-terminal domain-containing protein, partial [Bacteroidales bacterium]|nr:chitobiase/beta-hexosaminidase C-terminal domain-containing protein [Bacteroidales bacterium]